MEGLLVATVAVGFPCLVMFLSFQMWKYLNKRS